MKRSKNLIILLAVLVVLIGAVVAVQVVNNAQEPVAEETPATVCAVKAEEVTAIGWFYVDESMAFEKTANGWAYTEDSDFPLDSSFLETMLVTLAQVDAKRTIEKVENFAEFGLDDPDCVVTVQTDEILELKFGDLSAMGDAQYVSNGDGNVYLVDLTIQDSFELGLYDVVRMETLPVMETKQIAMITKGEEVTTLLRQENSDLAYSNKYVWFLHNGDSYQTLDTELTENWLDSIAELSWSACVDHNAEESELEAYGLAEPAAVITFVYLDKSGNSTTFSLEFGKISGNYCHAKLAGSAMVYKVDAHILDSLQNTTYFDLRPDEVLLMDWKVLTGLDVTLDGVTYEFRKAEGQDEYHMNLNGAEVEITVLRNMLNEMATTGHADGTVPEQNAGITFKFYQNSETFPEVELVFYPYNSTDYLTTVNGEAKHFVSQERVNNIIQVAKTIVGA